MGTLPLFLMQGLEASSPRVACGGWAVTASYNPTDASSISPHNNKGNILKCGDLCNTKN